MGLKWSKARSVKDNTLLVLNAPMPENKVQKDNLFTLWKSAQLKEQIKADGFRLTKDNYRTNEWQVAYWHEVNDQSHVKTTNGIPTWQADFNRKCTKWEQKINQI